MSLEMGLYLGFLGATVNFLKISFVRKGCDGEEKLKKKNVEKSGPLTFLPVNLLNSNQLQPQSSSQINKEETKWYWIRLGSSGLD